MKMNWHHHPVFICVALCGLFPHIADAFLRVRYADPEVVQRAELIVVAHVSDDPHDDMHQPDHTGEYRVALVVTGVIKGKTPGPQIQTIIHGGLTPIVGGFLKSEHFMFDVRGHRRGYPSDVIEIFDTGNSARSFEPIADDIRKDHIWFLRVQRDRDASSRGEKAPDAVGIWDPEDVQPLELRPYFQAFLAEQPAEQLKAFVVGQTPLATRSRNYLVHLDIEKASQEPDLAKRAELLLPFCLFTNENERGPLQWEALIKMQMNCEQAGAARLVPVFNDSTYKAMQHSIMEVWAQTEYHDSLPIVTALLDGENRYWRRQSITDQDTMVPEHDRRMDLVQQALLVLNRLADPTSKQVVEETQRVWAAPERQLVNDGPLQLCDTVLRSIAEAKDRAEDGTDPYRLEERKKSDLEVTNAKRIVLACKIYAGEHDGAYPKILEELVPVYTDEKVFVSPFSNDPRTPSYEYLGGSEKEPSKKIVLRSRFATSNGKRTIVYNDGIAERRNDK